MDGIQYYECITCSSLFAEPSFIENVVSGKVRNYDETYWEFETRSARERSFGSSLQRVAETFFYARRQIINFLDVGSGPGYLLDAFSTVLPESADMIYGVEYFPPPEAFRTMHPNYRIGQVGDLEIRFDAGVCIEVIEHLPPEVLDILIAQLAAVSNPRAVYFFNSAQPSFVKTQDPGYLDPHIRGHIVSYGLQGLKGIFNRHGFQLIPLYGRDWAFLAEFMGETVDSPDELLGRIWSPHPMNRKTLCDSKFGPLMHSVGLESARCYVESHIAAERTTWALSLDAEVQELRRRIVNP
ncbi:methyltransferase domain-containing protein [Bordetella genomosp. 10]|uniref:methyltransferase domain-containing protein n=1 Tax=Bordetella genomosp. 10 TaxID=1416804 RepID=UPI0015C644FD|nr:methyltransferase domain-containing protein [Bordetella genomosp. 10]